ncbi:hypothetical protein [Enterococcus termitis]|uniref:Uncharacterized protein n=2 Tax=Enterococcus termitis TaxID=332950 RepID=A0A1E5GVL9_9ENTE|nr:hypothetical protein [Enterococcus termitis]OEG16764.1 hypothetical protein BCR25_03990 [Enterococcus termitis]OJG99474.1 hypothetical protein RV18_GL001542 [Enterococcus termitis]
MSLALIIVGLIFLLYPVSAVASYSSEMHISGRVGSHVDADPESDFEEIIIKVPNEKKVEGHQLPKLGTLSMNQNSICLAVIYVLLVTVLLSWRRMIKDKERYI